MTRLALIHFAMIVFVAQAAQATCNLPVDLYQAKLPEACKSVLLSKATDAQDKIYLERLFKDWKPYSSYEFTTDENGYLEMENQKTGEATQMQWISLENPAILWMNGQVVVDEDKDPSLYRRIDRLMIKVDKAEQQLEREEAKEATTSATEKSVWLKFFAADQANAQAEKPEPAHRKAVQNAALIFTLHNGKSGSAEKLVGSDHDGAFAWADLKSGGYFPKMTGETFVCDGKKIRGDVTQDLSGRQVKVGQLSRRTFVVAGLIDGKELRVSMKTTDRHKYETDDKGNIRYVRNKQTGKRVPRSLMGRACQDRYNNTLTDTCNKAWEDFAKSRSTPEEQARVRAYIEETNKDKGGKGVYGRDFTCHKLYSGKGLDPKNDKAKIETNLAQKRECNAHFFTVVPPNLKVNLSMASFEACDLGGKNCKSISPEELAKLRHPPAAPGQANIGETKSERLRLDAETLRARGEYERAVAAAVKEKNSSVAVSGVCPPPGTENVAVRARNPNERGEDGQIGSAKNVQIMGLKFDACKAPSEYRTMVAPGKLAELTKLHQAAQKPERTIAAAQGAVARGDVERRVMGMMMMSECCGNDKCRDSLKTKMGIDLRSGSPAGGAPARR